MANIAEKRTAPLGLRVFPSVKAALEKAAEDDQRPMASMAEKIIIGWLKERGYLPKDGK